MATKADIIKQTLRHLRKLGSNREPAGEDSDIVGERLDRIYAKLRRRGLTNDAGAGVWALSAVPDEYADDLMLMAADACADTFMVPENRLVRLRLDAVNARNEIARISGRLRRDEPVVAEQF